MILVRLPDYQADKVISGAPQGIEAVINSYVNKEPISCEQMVGLIEILTIAKIFTEEGKRNAA